MRSAARVLRHGGARAIAGPRAATWAARQHGFALARAAPSVVITRSMGMSTASARCASSMASSKIFEPVKTKMGDTEETVLVGGRHLFPKLKDAFKHIKKISVIGFSSQGPAQAMNLRDSLEGTGIKVCVGLREDSRSFAAAEKCGFKKEDGTLGEMWSMIADSDMVILLIADAAQTELYPQLMKTMKSGATLGLSHGFLLGHMESVGDKFREDIDVVLAAPKGFGPSVRRLYVQGKDVNGAGINCSMAVHQNYTGNAVDCALGWAVAIGAPYVFETTLTMEYKSDIFGERGSLLGGLHGMVEFLYRHYVQQGHDKEAAFRMSAEAITGPISKTISRQGMLAVYDSFTEEGKREFEKAYSAAYHPHMEILMEIYDDVATGREIGSVVSHNARLKTYPLGIIDGTDTWETGKKVRAARDGKQREVNPTTAGVYIACLMAQAELLLSRGHAPSEVVNESIIEAVDSLNPYVDYKGIAHMVDNCSNTARMGSRKWAPRFDYLLWQNAGRKLLEDAPADQSLIEAFKKHRVHDILKVAGEMRPSVDISVVDAN